MLVAMVIVFLAGFGLATMAPAGQTLDEEYLLKSAYLGKLPSFVYWPEEQAGGIKAPIRICIYGNFSFGLGLARVTERETVNGRPIQLRLIRKEQEFRTCQVVFVSRSEAKRYAKVLELARGSNALTVGESSGFLEAGGMVELEYSMDSLVFSVNLDAVRNAHLRIDSRLLSMAKRVLRVKAANGH